MEINDVVYSNGGYNCTNVHFYKVIGVTPKSIKLVELKQNVKGDYRGYCSPMEETKNDTVFVARLNKNNDYIITHYKGSSWGKELVRLFEGEEIWWDSGYSRKDPIYK